MMKKNRKLSHKLPALVLVAVICSVLLPLLTNAAESGPGIFSCTTSPIDCTVYYTKAFLANMIALVGSGINSATTMPIAGVPVVTSSWNIVRGFANMFFILALIIMAFGTIFSIQKYDFRTLIARFLIAALLINFSLVIGEIIIDWSASLSNVFLGAIGNVGDRLAQGADLGEFFNQNKGVVFNSGTGTTLDGLSWTTTMRSMMDIVMLSIIFFSLVVLLFFSVIRVPILWALLIISPIAWITYILPTTMSVNRLWWKQFIGWNVFMPIYLFFIYFGVLFLGKKDEILTATNQLSGISTTFQDIFFYILIGIFLIGGAKIAISSSMSAGAGGVAAGIWARGRATARFARSLPGKGIGAGLRATGAEGAYKEARERLRKEGLGGFERFEGTALGKIFRGERGRDERTAEITRRLGIPGVAEKNFTKNVDYETQKMREKKMYDNPETLRGYIRDGTPEQKAAAAKLLKEFHVEELNGNEISEVYNAYNSSGLTAQASKFLAGVNYKKLSREELEQLRGLAVNPGYQNQFMERISDALIEKGPRDTNNLVELLGRYQGEHRNESIVDALKKTKDFRDNLGKAESTELLNNPLFANNPEARRIIAESSLKKGYLNETNLGNIVGSLDANGNITGGIYENDLQREQALNLAKDTEFEASIQLQSQLGLLRDRDGNYIHGNPTEYRRTRAALSADEQQRTIDHDTEEAMAAQAERKSITQILKMSNDTLRSQRFQRIIEPHLDTRDIEQMSNNSEYTSAKGGALENLMELIRERDIVAEKINPLTELLHGSSQQPVGIEQITENMRSASNERTLRDAKREADGLKKRASGLLADITKSRFAPSVRKDSASADYNKVVGDLDETFKSAEERLKPPRGGRGEGGGQGGEPRQQPRQTRPQGPQIVIPPEAKFKLDKERREEGSNS